jgi:NADPH:quinone reductase-like Zn-dependent oxidoreductase
MKAAVLEGTEKPLVIKEVADPAAAPGWATVRVRAAALNHRDLWIRQGRYPGLKFPIILGSDGAGVVAAVGREADRGWVGRPVIINPSLDWGDDPRVQGPGFRILGLPDDGTLAETVAVPVANLASPPAHLSTEQAAALPLGGLTAWRALFARGGLRAGETVLVTGIGGGVALLALQFAVAAGAAAYVTSGSAAGLFSTAPPPATPRALIRGRCSSGRSHSSEPRWVRPRISPPWCAWSKAGASCRRSTPCGRSPRRNRRCAGWSRPRSSAKLC